MNRDDVRRELEKIRDVLDWAAKHHTRENEANAALHLNEKVFYSPLTTQLVEAQWSIERMIRNLTDVEDVFAAKIDEAMRKAAD